MKKIFLILLIASSLNSQEFETEENELIKLNFLGFSIKGKEISWVFGYTPKIPDIEKIEVYEYGKLQKPIITINKQDVYEAGFKHSPFINPPDFDWIYENGLSTKPFAFTVFTKKGNITIYKAYTFTFEAKSGWRNFIEMNTKYKKEPVEVPHYHYLDFRKWILFNVNENENETNYEYLLESELNNKPIEIFSQNLIKNETNIESFYKKIEENVRKICPQSNFQLTKIENNKFFYTIIFNECSEKVPSIEMGSLLKNKDSILNVRYIYLEQNYPEKTVKVWKNILQKE